MRFFWAIVLILGGGLALMLSSNWIRGLLGGTSSGSGDPSLWDSFVGAVTGDDEEEAEQVTDEDMGFWAAAFSWPFTTAQWAYESAFGDDQ
jgi:hypothetical protein